MVKTICITGATDGIGLETAKLLAVQGHRLIIHGRSNEKLNDTKAVLSSLTSNASIAAFQADFSRLAEVSTLAASIAQHDDRVDVLINNAGVFKASQPVTDHGIDIRFVVNTLAPYVLTQALLGRVDVGGRVINLASAAQAAVDLDAFSGRHALDERQAYAQSKLALTMWSCHLAAQLDGRGPSVIAVNPGSLLGSKMVKEAFGIAGSDLSIGAEVLVKAALSEDFSGANGCYYDNDNQCFADPHEDALDADKNAQLTLYMDRLLERLQASN